MNTKKFLSSIAAGLAIAALVSAPAAAQRKQASAGEKPTSPQAEMKKGEKPRVFVAAAAGTNETWTNDITRQTLEEALVNSGRFEVIAGTQRDNLLREQGFSNSDLVDPAQNAKVGRMLAAKYVVSGTAQSVTVSTKSSGTGGLGSRFGGGLGGIVDKGAEKNKQKVTARVQIQMTDLEKGTIVPGSTKTYELSNAETSTGFEQKSTDNPQEAGYRAIISEVAKRYISDVNALVPIEALVAAIKGSQVVLNAGSNAGVMPGMKFEIYEEGEAITDPATGEVLDRETTKVAVVTVASAAERTATADIVRTFTNGSPDGAPDPAKIVRSMSARSMPERGGAAATGDEGGGGKKKKHN
jgi:curli biogenesis system outer membrane secretion channel CsgG